MGFSAGIVGAVAGAIIAYILVYVFDVTRIVPVATSTVFIICVIIGFILGLMEKQQKPNNN